ncbi:MAG: YfhO family protein, partial [Actinomycetota bacterium]|nr:YfhO family protein [Actinomycetota bacterium]
MRWRRALVEVPPLVLLVVAAAVYLGPALAHGSALGPYDILSTSGLTAHANATVHNWIGSDELEEFIAWQNLAWQQVHGGHLPLWNPYGLMGLPLAFDFQSAPFSLPVVVSYLFPLSVAHDAAIVSRLVIGGSGAYVLGRVLGLGRWPSALAGVVFELSGAFTIWLGAYEAGVCCFLGWIVAAVVSLARGRHRVRDVALVAVTVALALYGGEPQLALVVVVSVAVVVVALAVGAARAGGSWRRVVGDEAAGVVAGVALAAPVYLPGVQLALASARSTGPLVQGLPLYDLTHLLFTAWDGTPTAPTQIVGPDNLYVSMLYVGTIPAVLAVVGLVRARRDAAVAGLAAVTGLVLAALFVSPVADLARQIPDVRVFRLVLATTVVDFGLAMLAGCGMAVLAGGRTAGGDQPGEGRLGWRVLRWATGGAAVTLAVLGVRLAMGVDHLSAAQQSARAGGFALPAAGVAVLAVVAALGGQAGRVGRHARKERAGRHRWRVAAGGVALFGMAGALLVQGGAGIWSSTSHPFATNRGIRRLERLAGTSLVGMGSCATNAFPPVGVLPNDNAAYRLVELAGFDPIVPKAYTVAYGRLTGGSTQVKTPPALFCPAMTTVALARRFGVSDVLEPPGAAGPAGTREVAVVDGEGVFAVPGSGRAVVTWRRPGGRVGRAVAPSSQPSPSSWRIAVDAKEAGRLVVAVTAVPGWHASLDGRPLALSVRSGLWLTAAVPAGRHTVTLSYWPVAFSIGLMVAGLAAVGLAAAGIVAGRRRRRRRSSRTRSRGRAASDGGGRGEGSDGGGDGGGDPALELEGCGHGGGEVGGVRGSVREGRLLRVGCGVGWRADGGVGCGADR